MAHGIASWVCVCIAAYLFFGVVGASIANGINLRIQPIGDSITDGYKSSDGNGYRKDLLDKLGGNSVQFIGSSHAGNMANNANDGYSGFEINQIAGRIGPALTQRPNVVLLMAGTNDINNNDDVGNAPNRLGSLLDQIISACPDAVIILAKITPIANAAAESRAQAYNSAIVGIAQSRINAGHKIVMVDMQNAQDGLTASDLNDGLHPTDNGYAKMANVWMDGLNTAAGQGWITAPVAGAPVASLSACSGSLFWYPDHGTVASGVGSSDGFFSSGWNPVGQVASGTGVGSGVHIADIDGDGIDDYIWIDPKSGAATLYINGGYSNGKINWQPKGQVASGIGDGPGVRFADIDGDGLADYIWIGLDGAMTAYRNGGPKSGGGWNWAPMNSITNGIDLGTRDTVIFADLNGDGRADYSILGPSGSLLSWIASGQSPEPVWLPLGHVASGIGDAAGVRLADLNGDGRADYIWINKASASYAYINQRSMDNLAPVWIDAKQIGSGVGADRGTIIFGDLTGDGKDDFLIVHNDTGAIDMYVNQGQGGSYQAGDLVTFADLDGDGLDDYVSVGPNGALLAYKNGGDKGGANNWLWLPWGTIASGVAKREQIRLADLNGDGKADYIYLDDKTGAASAYINGGQDPKDSTKWIWYPIGKIAGGIGFPGRMIHFADINGDGKADYLAVDTAGAVTAYLNGGANPQANLGWVWYPAGKIASGVGQGSEIRFADIDGDGKADYLVVSQTAGRVTEYQNGGQNSNANGGWIWYPRGQIATGVGATGQSIVFGAVSSRRADYLVVTPASAAVFMWANGCSASASSPGSGGSSSGGDDGSGLFDPDGGDVYPDNYEPPIDPNHYAACNALFTNIDDVNKQQDSIPPYCINKYITDSLIAMWTDGMHKYNDLINGGYDEKFGYYAGYVKQEVPLQIDAFMGNGHADDFFDCIEHGRIECCSECRFGDCSGCSRAPNCVSGYGARKITCPTVYANGRPSLSFTGNAPNTTYVLRDSDGFYKAIADQYGIIKDWLVFQDVLVILSNGCQFAGADVQKCEKQQGIWFWSYPQPGNVVVTNPKDIVSKTKDASQDMLQRMKYMQLGAGLDGQSLAGDLVDAGSIPVLAVLAAIDAMAKVADAGAKIEDEERKEMILNFVTAILFFIPFVGEAAGAAGLVAVRTIIELIGVAGDVAMATYGVVSDPKDAVATIFTTLIGAGLGRVSWKKGADAKRGMSPEDIGKLGSIAERLKTVNAARIRMCKL